MAIAEEADDGGSVEKDADAKVEDSLDNEEARSRGDAFALPNEFRFALDNGKTNDADLARRCSFSEPFR